MSDIKREFEKGVANIKDAVNETGHRVNADAEHSERELNRDTMTTSEKAGSIFREGKEEVAAEIDKTKRQVRENT